MLNIVVLVSGGGTNLQAIMDKIADGTVTNTKIAAVISNNANAYALQRAANAGIPAECISPKQFENRELFNEALLAGIKKYNPDFGLLIVSNSLKHKTEDGNSKADNGYYHIGGVINYSEEHRADLHRVKNRNGDPNSRKNEHGHLLLIILSKSVLCNVGLSEGCVLKFSYKEEAGKTRAVSNEERCLNENDPHGGVGRVDKIHNEDCDTAARNCESVTNREEVHELIKSYGAHNCAYRKKNSKK